MEIDADIRHTEFKGQLGHEYTTSELYSARLTTFIGKSTL